MLIKSTQVGEVKAKNGLDEIVSGKVEQNHAAILSHLRIFVVKKMTGQTLVHLSSLKAYTNRKMFYIWIKCFCFDVMCYDMTYQ